MLAVWGIFRGWLEAWWRGNVQCYGWKFCSALVGPASMAPVGVIPLPGGVAECSAIVHGALYRQPSPGRKPWFVGSARWRRLSDVVSLLGASCLEIRGPMLRSSGVHRCPNRFSLALCMVVAGSSWEAGVVVLRWSPASVETRRGYRFWVGSVCRSV